MHVFVRVCVQVHVGECPRARVCVCVCVLTPQLAEGENSFACPFTLLPSAAQCSSSHWTKRPHCGIQMKERGGEQCIERTKGLVVGYGGWVWRVEWVIQEGGGGGGVDRWWGVKKREGQLVTKLAQPDPNSGAAVPFGLLCRRPASHRHSHTILRKARLHARSHRVCFCACFKVTLLIQQDDLTLDSCGVWYTRQWTSTLGKIRQEVCSESRTHLAEFCVCESLRVFGGCLWIQT